MSEIAKRFAVQIEWTDECVELLKKLWDEVLPTSQIAAKIGVSKSAVIGKVHRLGLQNRREASPAKARAVPTLRCRKSETIHKRFIAPIFEAEPIPDTEDEDIPPEQRKTLLELTDDTCRWGVGDPQSPDFFFCGGRVAETLVAGKLKKRPYCHRHCMIAYHPPSDRKISERHLAYLNGEYRRKAE